MFRKRGCVNKYRVAGFLLMLLGLIVMMLTVPCWAWAGVICMVLIVVGFLLWKFS